MRTGCNQPCARQSEPHTARHDTVTDVFAFYGGHTLPMDDTALVRMMHQMTGGDGDVAAAGIGLGTCQSGWNCILGWLALRVHTERNVTDV